MEKHSSRGRWLLALLVLSAAACAARAAPAAPAQLKPPPKSKYATLYQALIHTPELAYMAKAAQLAGLQKWLDDPDSAVTVFLVRPEAYAAMQAALKDPDSTNRDTAIIKPLIEYHMLTKPYTAEQLPLDTPLPNLLDPKDGVIASKQPDGGIMINEALITKPNYMTVGKSQVHIIKQFLIPPSETATILGLLKPGADLAVASGAVDAGDAFGVDGAGGAGGGEDPLAAFAGGLQEPEAAEPAAVKPGPKSAAAQKAPAKAAAEDEGVDPLFAGFIKDDGKPAGDKPAAAAPATEKEPSPSSTPIASGGPSTAAAAPAATAAAAARAPVTLFDVSGAVQEISMITDLIKSVGPLRDFLSNPDLNATVFAPTNGAIKAFLGNMGRNTGRLVSNDAMLLQFMQYGLVSSGAFTTAQLKSMKYLPAMGGEMLRVTHEGGVIRINNIPIVKPNIRSGLSVVHVIDGIPVPPSLQRTFSEWEAEAKAPYLAKPESLARHPAAAAAAVLPPLLLALALAATMGT